MQKTIYSKKYGELVASLKEARLNVGLTQKDVAQKLKKTQSYVSKVEAGEQRLDVIELKAFAEIYKKNVNDFVR